jgi:hypothetical protein
MNLGLALACLYVRTYHKDSVVRSFGDFNTEKEKKLDTFTLNEIEWEVFEIKNTPEVHFIGSSGEYMYEVVTQGVSYEETKNLLEFFENNTPRE